MPTLLLPPRQSPDASALWRAAIRLNWKIIRLQRWAVPEEITPEDEVVLYSGWAMAISDDLGLYLLEPSPDWLTTVPHEYLHRNLRFCTLADARNIREPAFIKPADGKSFPSSTYTSGAELMPEGILSEQTPALVSDIVSWELEFRCFVLDRKVLTLSPYLRHGRFVQTPEGEFPATDEEFAAASAFAAKVLADPRIELPPAVVLDVGLIENRGWAVIETNAAWGSGIYGCDGEGVLAVIRRACVRKTAITASDKRWLIERREN